MTLDVGTGYLPEFVLNEVLPNLPRHSGEGIHRALFDLARVLTPYRSAGERAAILRCYAAQVDRPVPETEIADALRCGALHAWKPDGSCIHEALRVPPHSLFDLENFKKFVAGAECIDAEGLIRRSPVPVEKVGPVDFLEALFLKGEKTLVFDDVRRQGYVWTPAGLLGPPQSLGTSLDHFVHGRRYGVWFLSNPTDAVYRVNSAGKLSRRSTQNIVSWRYLLVESDRSDISEEEWLTAIVRLELPIAAVTATGHRLSHALIHINAASQEEWNTKRDALRPDLIMIGADVASLSGVRLTRLPGCYRAGREDADGVYRQFPAGPRLQRLLFLNPPTS